MSNDVEKKSEREPTEEDESIKLPEHNDGESITFSEEDEPVELPEPNDGETVTKGG